MVLALSVVDCVLNEIDEPLYPVCCFSQIMVHAI